MNKKLINNILKEHKRSRDINSLSDLKDNYKVKSIDMSDSKYQGMNYYANKELHTGYNMNENDILIDKKLSRKNKVTTISHELIERRLMKQGMKYKSADRIAKKYEYKGE